MGSAKSNLTYGDTVSKAFGIMGMDALTVGNHEFDFNTNGNNYIPTWATNGSYETLGANVIDNSTGQVANYLKPYTVIEKSGKKVGVLGLATIETAFKTTPAAISGLTFEDYLPLTQMYVDKL